jgi:hypothetical protein
VVFPSEQNTMWHVGPEILISILAYCTLSQGVEHGPWIVEEPVSKNQGTQLAMAIARGESITAPNVEFRNPKNRPLGRCVRFVAPFRSVMLSAKEDFWHYPMFRARPVLVSPP